MLHNCDEDSGRSSCSATSGGLSPIIDQNGMDGQVTSRRSNQINSLSAELKVSMRPRSCILMSPSDKDPFPSCRQLREDRKAVFNLYDPPRRDGLSNAHSTLDIVSSTRIDQAKIETNAISLNGLETNDDLYNKGKQATFNNNFKRSKPVQRAASRLYKADCGFKGKDGCIGPEFIVRASQPAKSIGMILGSAPDKRIVTVVLLNGQKVDVDVDPNSVTAGLLFKALMHSEKYDHNFMLGIAVLVCGDFIFLPDDYKIKKVAPESWHKTGNKKKNAENYTLTVFLRIKFFLPNNIAKNIQGGEWQYRVYLQLRRATVEGQLTSTIQNLVLLAGYALHIEFGEFSYREHGTADYFLLEHYLPETAITTDMADIKLRMKKAHESRRSLDRNKAILNYITLAQTFRDYGAHFYSAIWATRDGFCRDIWLSIGPKGVTLYSRNNYATADAGNNRIVLQSLPWHHIHTFYYNKKSLYIIPNLYSGLSKAGIKYKLKMTDNKSYFTFWLASLHHKLYLKLYAKEDFITYLANETNCPKECTKQIDCSNYQDSYNLAVRNPVRVRRPVRKRFRVEIFGDKKNDKENEKPNTEELLRKILIPQNSEDEILNISNTNAPGNTSNDGPSSSDCSLPRRQGVKMGTRVFAGMKSTLHNKYPKSSTYHSSSECLKSDVELATTHSDSDDLSSEQKQHCNVNSMKLLPERNYNQDLCHTATAYVLESPKVYSDVYNFSVTPNDSYVNTSLFEKLDNMGCVQGERIFVTAVLERNEANALGLQVAEGSDGNVYVKSITPGGPADLNKKIMPGDQIISVNGQTLLNVKYNKALTMLQSAPKQVELIVLQIAMSAIVNNNDVSTAETRTNFLDRKSQNIANAIDVELTNDELLNEEALRTIYALIKLTKEKVINRMIDKSSKQNTPIKNNLYKCYSENKVYVDSGTDKFSSQESIPQKKTEKCNTWRGQPNNQPKKRPMSLCVPKDVNLPENYLENNIDDLLMRNSSIKSIQSSLNSLDRSVKSSTSRNVALPRNFGLSRRWMGPVRYPVTPCKNSNGVITGDNNSAMVDENVIRKHFVYGAGDSDEDQIFL